MDNRNKIAKTLVYKLSLISSICLFFSTALAYRLWSGLWILYGFIELALILICGGTVLWGIIFWIKKYKEYRLAFLPCIISSVFIALIIILPLNDIRTKLEFSTFKNQYENAVDFVLSSNTDPSNDHINYKLPWKYKFLSTGGGEVIVINKAADKGVFFYTFRGAPDGMSGFFKIKGDGKIENMKADLCSRITELKYLGDNWYYIAGN